MTKRALLAVVGLLGCCLTLFAQETLRPVLFPLGQPVRSTVVDNRTAAFSALSRSYSSFPALTLLDGRLVSLLNAFTWIEATPPDFLPAASAKEPRRTSTVARSRRDLDNAPVDVRARFFDYVGGEVGVLYGRSVGGKSDGELKQGYIFGEMGNDKTQISVGAFYEESSGGVPRRGH